MKKTLSFIAVIFISFFAFLIILRPEICLKSTLSGILICGNVIIPSIYPFTFCVLFIKSSGALKLLKPFDFITKFLFHLSFYEFSLFLLSLLGGYPTGAKLLSGANIENKKLNLMLSFCINASPAFVILAVGKGVFKSAFIGWVLYLSHILSSLIIALCLGRFIKKENGFKMPKSVGAVNNFVQSAADSADTVIKICGLVILFSAVYGYIEMLSLYIKPLKYLGLLCEVTTSVFKTDRILLSAFLLSFGGFGIWCQIFAILKHKKINYLLFAAFRVLQGILSASLTFLLLKAFKITVFTLSNNINFNISAFINGPSVAISLIIMGIVLIISLYNKKYAGNLIEEMV